MIYYFGFTQHLEACYFVLDSAVPCGTFSKQLQARCCVLQKCVLAALSQCSMSSDWDPMPQRSRTLNVWEVGGKKKKWNVFRQVDFHLPTKPSTQN